MSKKKTNSFLAKIKNKLGKKSDETLENESEIIDDLDGHDDFEESDITGEHEILDHQESTEELETSQTEEEITYSDDEQDEITFSSQDDLSIEEELTSGSIDLKEFNEADDSDLNFDTVEEEEEEEFVAQEFKIDDKEKQILEELDDSPLLHEGEGQNPMEVEGVEAATGQEAITHNDNDEVQDDQEYEEYESEYNEEEEELEYDDNDFQEMNLPRPSIKQRFLTALTSLKSKAQGISKGTSNNPSIPKSSSENVAGLSKIKDINWDELVSRIFSPSSRKFIHKAFITSMFSFMAYFGGKGLALYLRPKESSSTKSAIKKSQTPRNNYRAATNKIKKANLFNALTQEGALPQRKTKKKKPQPSICRNSKKTSSLPLKLVSTTVLQDSVKSVASVQVRGASQLEDIREGETLDKFAKIGRIETSRLTFKNIKSGECEFIESKDKKDKPSPIEVVSPQEGKKLLKPREGISQKGNNFKIKNKVREELLSNMSEVLTQAKAIQIKNPDGTLSFKMTNIVPGSIYSQLDIQENDTISAINGKKFNNLNDLMSLFGRIRDIPNFTITKKRDGSEMTSDYNFED
jgi:type II secretory pathway component PulC